MKIDKILSIPKSFWVSLHFFTLRDALKLPILVRYNTKIQSLRGEIGGGCPRTTDHKSEILQSVSSSDDSCLSYGNNYQLLGDNTSNPSSATYNLNVENSQN